MDIVSLRLIPKTLSSFQDLLKQILGILPFSFGFWYLLRNEKSTESLLLLICFLPSVCGLESMAGGKKAVSKEGDVSQTSEERCLSIKVGVPYAKLDGGPASGRFSGF